MSDKQSEMLRTLTILLLAVGLAGCTSIVIAPPAKGGWQALEGRPECRIWNPNRASQGTASWDGPCVKDRAQGEGTLVWRYPAGQRRLEQVYTGTMRRGRRHGHGIYSWPNGDRYEGYYVNDWAEGRGIYTWGAESRWAGDRYDGLWRRGRRHGPGHYAKAGQPPFRGLWRDGVMIASGPDAPASLAALRATAEIARRPPGEWLQVTNQRGCEVWNPISRFGDKAFWSGACIAGKAHGHGVLQWSNGDLFEGTLVAGRRQGWAAVTLASGRRKEGRLENGRFVGRGVFWSLAGVRHEGTWQDGVLVGRGVREWPDGNRYEGELRNGKRHGRGVMTFGAGSKFAGNRYEGDWRNDHTSGHGIYTWANGEVHDGQWANDLRHGAGFVTYRNGNRCEGEWRDFKLLNAGRFWQAAKQRWGSCYWNGKVIKARFEAQPEPQPEPEPEPEDTPDDRS